MNRLYFMAIILIAGCGRADKKNISLKADSLVIEKVAGPETTHTEIIKIEKDPPPPPAPKVYSNKRFKDVTVEKTGEHTFLVKGKGQIFEASFSWIVEDGHNELKKGFTTTDAGAPAWGNFSFTINVKKERENSTLHLIIFEASAKDGSRQYELPILLY